MRDFCTDLLYDPVHAGGVMRREFRLFDAGFMRAPSGSFPTARVRG